MNAFVLETLYPSGWRRTAELYWRRCDAEAAGQIAINRDKARAIRILSATIASEAILEVEAPLTCPRNTSSKRSTISA